MHTHARYRTKGDRERFADRCCAAIDTRLFRALAEPVRVELIGRLIRQGPADIARLAAGLLQDRSVVSRHLRALERAGVVRSERRGRCVCYRLDGPALIAMLEPLLDTLRNLVPVCCPEPRGARDEDTQSLRDTQDRQDRQDTRNPEDPREEIPR